MNFKIDINIDNEAFQVCLSDEIARVLDKVKHLIQDRAIIELDKFPLMDSNGNKVGLIRLTK